MVRSPNFSSPASVSTQGAGFPQRASSAAASTPSIGRGSPRTSLHHHSGSNGVNNNNSNTSNVKRNKAKQQNKTRVKYSTKEKKVNSKNSNNNDNNNNNNNSASELHQQQPHGETGNNNNNNIAEGTKVKDLTDRSKLAAQGLSNNNKNDQRQNNSHTENNNNRKKRKQKMQQQQRRGNNNSNTIRKVTASNSNGNGGRKSRRAESDASSGRKQQHVDEEVDLVRNCSCSFGCPSVSAPTTAAPTPVLRPAALADPAIVVLTTSSLEGPPPLVLSPLRRDAPLHTAAAMAEGSNGGHNNLIAASTPSTEINPSAASAVAAASLVDGEQAQLRRRGLRVNAVEFVPKFGASAASSPTALWGDSASVLMSPVHCQAAVLPTTSSNNANTNNNNNNVEGESVRQQSPSVVCAASLRSNSSGGTAANMMPPRVPTAGRVSVTHTGTGANFEFPRTPFAVTHSTSNNNNNNSNSLMAEAPSSSRLSSSSPVLSQPHSPFTATDVDNVRHTRITLSDMVAQDEALLVQLLVKEGEAAEDEDAAEGSKDGSPRHDQLHTDPSNFSDDEEEIIIMEEEAWEVHSTASTASHLWKEKTLGGYWSLSGPRASMPRTSSSTAYNAMHLNVGGGGVQASSTSHLHAHTRSPEFSLLLSSPAMAPHEWPTAAAGAAYPNALSAASPATAGAGGGAGMYASSSMSNLLEDYEDIWEVNSSAYADSLDDAEVQWIEEQLRVSGKPANSDGVSYY